MEDAVKNEEEDEKESDTNEGTDTAGSDLRMVNVMEFEVHHLIKNLRYTI